MKITYDKIADAVYIEFREGKFSANKKVDDLTIVDFDSKDNILGIEILDASKRIPLGTLNSVNDTPIIV